MHTRFQLTSMVGKLEFWSLKYIGQLLVRQQKLSTCQCTVNVFSIQLSNHQKNLIKWSNLAHDFSISLNNELGNMDFQWKGVYCIRTREVFLLAHSCLRQLQHIQDLDPFHSTRIRCFVEIRHSKLDITF